MFASCTSSSRPVTLWAVGLGGYPDLADLGRGILDADFGIALSVAV
jgi:hypothetical protein